MNRAAAKARFHQPGHVTGLMASTRTQDATRTAPIDAAPQKRALGAPFGSRANSPTAARPARTSTQLTHFELGIAAKPVRMRAIPRTASIGRIFEAPYGVWGLVVRRPAKTGCARDRPTGVPSGENAVLPSARG